MYLTYDNVDNIPNSVIGISSITELLPDCVIGQIINAIEAKNALIFLSFRELYP